MNEERLPFFVYGTLLPGQPNAYLWGDSVTHVEPATLTRCHLYNMGVYPMLVEEGDSAVVGVVQTVTAAEYEAVLARVDHLEGYDPNQPDETWYRRVVREVVGENGRSHQAWVYIGHPKAVRGLEPIPGGDWAAYAATAFRDIDQWWQELASVHHLSEDYFLGEQIDSRVDE